MGTHRLETASAVADGLLAATALEHRLTVVTRNGADFAGTGVATLDPFLAPAS